MQPVRSPMVVILLGYISNSSFFSAGYVCFWCIKSRLLCSVYQKLVQLFSAVFDANANGIAAT